MKTVITAALLIALGSQSYALSCMRPDPIETFQRLAAASESYFVLHGRFTFDESDLPAGVNDFQQTDDPAPIPGWFEGQGLSQDGFVTPYQGQVQLQVTCAGPWCGSARSGSEAIYFVPFTQPPVSLQADPCGGMIFYDPTPAVLAMLTSCMQGSTCAPIPAQ